VTKIERPGRVTVVGESDCVKVQTESRYSKTEKKGRGEKGERPRDNPTEVEKTGRGSWVSRATEREGG